MIKDISYIIKRIIIGVGIVLLLGFIKGDLLLGVSALSFPQPNSIQITNNNNSTTIYNGSTVLASWYGGNLYTSPDTYRRDWINGRVNVWYQNLCYNKIVNAQVTVMTYDSRSSGIFFNSLNRLKVYNGQSESACALNSIQQNGKVATYTCNFTDYGTAAFFVNNLTFENTDFSLGIGVDSTYTCSPTTSDIIQSNQDQTNQIINNNNNNTTSIIQNNDSNTNKITQEQQETTDAVNNVNNTLNDDNVNTQQASDFFSNFQSNNHGLSGIITSPLRLIQSLSSSQCSSLVLPLPFVNQSATIPCMSTVYNRFPTFYNLWQLISTGLIAYYILINLFAKVHSLQNPQEDRIEVLNL